MRKDNISKLYFRYLMLSLIGVSVLLFLFLSKTSRAYVYVGLFILASTIVSGYKRFIKLPVEFELLTIGIVVSTLSFGLQAGLAVAILGGILSFIVGFNISPFSFPMLLGYISIALVSFFMKDFNLLYVGLFASIINNAIVFLVYHFVFSYDFMKNISFSVSNLLFNAILFFNIAPFLIRLIG